MPSDRVLIDHPVAAAAKLLPSMEGRFAIVTGASSGLGSETAKWLALRGCDEVVLAVRNTEKAQGVVDAIVAEWGAKVPDLQARLKLMKLDLASLASVREFAAAYAKEHKHLDILVNNAGVNTWGTKTEDGFEMMWGVNHLATTLLTHELLPLLIAPPTAPWCRRARRAALTTWRLRVWSRTRTRVWASGRRTAAARRPTWS